MQAMSVGATTLESTSGKPLTADSLPKGCAECVGPLLLIRPARKVEVERRSDVSEEPDFPVRATCLGRFVALEGLMQAFKHHR